GWYVADNVSLPKAFADHVAVGPAGVFVVQILWTDLEAQQGDPLARARIASWQLRTVLQNQELAVEVVPVVLVWGPTLGQGEAATEVVDSVLVLVGSRTHEWLPDLIGQRHLDSGTVELVRSAIAGVWPATARATLPV
ncbi:MAG: hypothetical protein ACRD0F_03840, partial [Acidimicrobiales bacterium]